MKDHITMTKLWTIRRYATHADFEKGTPTDLVDSKGRKLPGVSYIHGNVLLNEGIAELQLLLTGGTATAFNNANSYLGVGDDATAAAAAQTGLIEQSNQVYVGMETSYPSISGQVTTWRAVYGSAVANWDWNEFTVANGNSDSADNLNRVVSDEGTKASGQTWTLDLAITWS